MGNIWEYIRDPSVTAPRRMHYINPDKSYRKLQFNKIWKLRWEEDELKNRTWYLYYDNGLLRQKRVEPNIVTRYEYDQYGNLTKVIEPNGNEKEYIYDELGRLLKETSSACCGAWKEYEYNDNDQVVLKRDALGNETRYSYDLMGNKIEKIDPRGNVTKYYYDVMGRITNTKRLGSEISVIKGYDANGNIIKEIDGNENVTKYTYDELNRLIAITNALGYVTQYKYDAAGNRTNIINERGNTTRIYYDANNRVTNRIDPLGYSRKAGYTYSGKKAYIIDKNGNRTDYNYNKRGDLIIRTDAKGNQEKWTYDAVGNKLSFTNKLRYIIKYTYNEMNKLIEIKDALGNISYNEYNNLGRKIKETDKNGNETRYFYDELNRLEATVNSKGFSYNYSYDGNNNLLSKNNYNNEVTFYEYDAFNRRIKRIDAMGNETVYEYDNNNNRTNIIDANGNSKKYFYDALNRLIKVKDTENRITEYKYDAVGNRTNIINAKGNKKRYYYDANKRLIKIKSPLGYETKYGYDNVGNKTKKTNPDGHVKTYIYNEINNLVEVNYDTGKIVKFNKDVLGRTTNYTSPEETGNMTYDALGRLIFWTNKTINKAIRYSYNAMGNRTAMIDAEGDEVTYQYDELNNLTSITQIQNSIIEPTNPLNQEVSEDKVSSFDAEYDKILNPRKIEEEDGVLKSEIFLKGSIDKNKEVLHDFRSLKIGNYTNNEKYKAYIAFNLSKIQKGSQINSAELKFDLNITNTTERSLNILIKNIDYGLYLDENDYNAADLSENPISATLSSSDTNCSINVTKLVKDAYVNMKPWMINESRYYAQFSIELLNENGCINLKKRVKLKIDYDEPETTEADSVTNDDAKTLRSAEVSGIQAEADCVIHVSINGNDNGGKGTITKPFRTIQKGIDHSELNNCNTVKVSEGIYQEHIIMANGVSLLGGYSSDFTSRDTNLINYRTKIDGTGDGRCIIVGSITDETKIEGLIISNGYLTGDRDYGAGIYCTNSSSNLIIKNNEIKNNTSSGRYSYGGGIYLWHSSPGIYNNKINNNYAYSGGGIYLTSSFSEIYDNTINNNTGKGIYMYNSTSKIYKNKIYNNAGGGLESYEGSLEIHNNIIKSNTENRWDW